MDPTETTPPEEQDPEAPDPEAEQAEDPNEPDAIEAVNILPLLKAKKPKWIDKIAARVISSAKEDDDSRQDYLKRCAAQLKLFAGEVKNFGYPAQGAKAPAIMLMSKAILHNWARIHDQVFPAKGDYVKGMPLGPNDMARCQRVEKHFNWQLRYRMPNWTTSHQFTMLGWLMQGSRFRYYGWDPVNKIHRVDDLGVEDVIISYTERDTDPRMPNVERITVVRRMARWEIEQYAEKKAFSNIEDVFPDLKEQGESDSEDGSTTDGDNAPTNSDDTGPVQSASEQIQGWEKSGKPSKYGKRELYEQHTMLTFPAGMGVQGVDGETLPVIITVDKQTKKPIALTLRQEPDPIDQERFNQETSAHQLQVQNTLAQHAQTPEGASGAPPPEGMLPAPPAPVRMQTVYRILHFGLFPNPEGFYRWGVGWLLEGSNELANVLAGEFVLSARFSNMKSGFMAKNTRAKPGDVQLAHGKFMETELEPEQLDKAIKVLDFGQPSQALLEMLGKLEENSEISASADILSGEKGTSNETKGGIQIRNANAMTLISVMTRLYLEPLRFELKLIAHGNSIYLDKEETFPFIQLIPGDDGQMQQIASPEKVFRADYVEDVHLEFTADARAMSKPERIQEAKDAYELIINSPLASNPQLVYYAMRKVFEVSDAFDYVAKMGPPPQPPPPPEPQAQETENAGFFNEKDHPVLPDDNHLEHLHKINELKNSPLHEHLSQTGKQLLDRHERAHVAQFYLQTQALQKQTGVPINGLVHQNGTGRDLGGAGNPQAPGQAPGGPGPGTQAPPNVGPNGGSPGNPPS